MGHLFYSGIISRNALSSSAEGVAGSSFSAHFQEKVWHNAEEFAEVAVALSFLAHTNDILYLHKYLSYAMGSSYTCIITREKIEVPREIPHFKKKGVLTIPFDDDGWAVSYFLRYFKDGELVLTPGADSKTGEDATDDDEPESILEETELLFNFLKSLGLTRKKFIVMYSSDHADIPTEHHHGAFEDGNLIPGTAYSDYYDDPGNYGAALDALDIASENIVFFSYFEDAATAHVETIFKPGLWRM